MSYPANLPTKQVSFGSAAVLEGGAPLAMRITISATRSLVHRPSGSPLIKVSTQFSSTGAGSGVVDLPICDSPSMGVGDGTSIILDAEHPVTHTYSALINYYTDDTFRTAIPGASRTVGPFALLSSSPSVSDVDDLLVGNPPPTQGEAVVTPAQYTSQGLQALGLPGDGDGLAASIAGTPFRRPGARLAVLSDSIGQAGDSTQFRGESFASHASLLSDRRLRFVRNGSKGGNTLAQMLARWDADIAPYRPNIVAMLAGANDSNQGVSLVTFKAGCKEFLARCQALKAVPVFITTPPKNYASGSIEETRVRDYNDFLRVWTQQEGHLLLDAFAIFAEAYQRFQYLAAFDNGDGIHPNTTGHRALGAALWALISPLVGQANPLLTQTASDPNNILANSCMIASTGGQANNWTNAGTPSAGTATLSMADDLANGVKGRLQRIALSGATGARTIEQYTSLSGKATAGDQLLFNGIATSSGGLTTRAFISFPGGPSGSYFTWESKAAFTRGVFEIAYTVPAGATHVQTQLAAADGTGTVDFGQVTLTNLTTRQLVGSL